MKHFERINRRTFLSRATASALFASTFPAIVPSSVSGADKKSAPSNRVTLGCIGTGDRGRQVMDHFLNQSNCRIVAVCDVKKDAMAAAKGMVDTRHQSQDCAVIHDFRELLARKDIDAVLIASTDNWHVLHALAAVRAGKDLYVEKPLAVSFGEDQLLRREVLQRGRVFQFGTQQRSDRKFRVACELVRNGYIGKLKHINIWAPASTSGGSTKVVPPPPTLDYDFWLGPAKFRSHTENLTQNTTWWHVSDFALGFIAGWGIHPMDIALWGAGELAEDKVEVAGTGIFPTQGICDTATHWDVNFQFGNGLTMTFVGVGESTFAQEKSWRERYGPIETHGTAFEGTEGWIHVDRNRISLQPESLIDINPETFKIKLTHSSDHVKSFLAAVKTRQATVSTIQSAVLADAFCHVPNLALRLKRNLTYDTKTETFPGDAEANKHLELRTARAPWQWEA